MAQPSNSASYIRGGNVYSNNRVVAKNQRQESTYFPLTTNGTLAAMQADATRLSALSGETSPDGSCYDESMLAQFILGLDCVP
jgi:hypothetical protein